MWLERLVIGKAEKKLMPYRDYSVFLDNRAITAYQNHLDQIKKIYQQTTHWHGTGRYHYEHRRDTRYEAVKTNKITDVLEAICKADGLMPHHDPWIDSNGKTVSLATTRMHARAFARIHAFKRKVLVYELGSIKFWLRFYFVLLFIWLFTNLWSHRHFIKDTLRATLSKDIQNWASAIRKPQKGKVIGILDIFKGDIPTSDIEGNYPVLIGIKANTNELIETIPLTHKVEQRSLQPITIEMFTHIEVPLQKTDETKKILSEQNVQIPVIPLEFGDIFLSETPLSELAFS